ncbi:hypothetical protein, partial [Acidithiobacillus ferridurans]|uniref:hypothetical protein n=1 Tax=Acidithiobacillus ferridurans TaxID=1232575 RepID=UPI001C07A035
RHHRQSSGGRHSQIFSQHPNRQRPIRHRPFPHRGGHPHVVRSELQALYEVGLRQAPSLPDCGLH